jgi:hypothetical protein
MGIWLALASVLLMSLLPTLSRLASPTRASEWVELCRGSSTVWVNLADAASKSDGKPSAPASPDHLFKHCPYCSIHVDMTAPGTPALHVPLMSAWQAFLPAAFLQALRTLHVWRVAQPRAPPSQA